MNPPIDMYGYPKLAFFTLRELFSPLCVVSADVEPLKAADFAITPVVFGTKLGKTYAVTVTVTDEAGNELDRHVYDGVIGRNGRTDLPAWQPQVTEDGYYRIAYSVTD